MLIFLESGRLGNQIFQYAALRSIASEKERLILIGFEDFKQTLEGFDAIFICTRKSFLFKFLTRYRIQIEKVIKRQSLFGLVYENQDKDKLSIVKKRGLININYTLMSFFQSQNSFDPKIIENISINSKLVYRANRIINNFDISKKKVFVHIRRGDYITYPTAQFPAILPAEWYMNCINKMNILLDNPFYIFVSDDTQYVNENFGHLQNKYVSEANSSQDFALMSECDGAILSPSSFAWWASYFIKQKNDDSIFIAPKYWIGHRRKNWHPEFIQTTFLEYEEVI
jgi:hypothetical protein